MCVSVSPVDQGEEEGASAAVPVCDFLALSDCGLADPAAAAVRACAPPENMACSCVCWSHSRRPRTSLAGWQECSALGSSSTHEATTGALPETFESRRLIWFQFFWFWLWFSFSGPSWLWFSFSCTVGWWWCGAVWVMREEEEGGLDEEEGEEKEEE